MNRSCRNCRNYEHECRYCFEHKIEITDVFNAGKCKSYKEKRKPVKCINCNQMKYTYCNIKRKCLSKEEQEKVRLCRFFRRRFHKKHNNKKH